MASPVLVLRILSPLYVLCTASSLFFTRPQRPTPPTEVVSVVIPHRVPRRAVILTFLSCTAFTYFLDGLSRVLYAVFEKKDIPADVEFNTVIGLAAFSGLAALGAWKDVHGVQVWFLRRIRTAVGFALVLDIVLAVLLALSIKNSASQPHRVPIPSLLGFTFPVLRVLCLVALFAALSTPNVVYLPVNLNHDVDESSPIGAPVPQDHTSALLPVPNVTDSTKYGTFRPGRSILQQSTPTTRAPTPTPSSHAKTDDKPDPSLDPTWSEVWKRLKRLAPYLWPSNSPSLQLIAWICIFILLLGRAVNVVTPFALGKLVSILEHPLESSPWLVLGVYVVLRFLQSSGGLAALRDTLWAPVMQYSDREMSQLSFNHLLNLSFSFHTKRKTGEILRVLDRGAVINNTFELILFNIVPTFFDIALALVVFSVRFEWTLALVTFFVMFAYVTASVILTQWRTKIRRQMNERDIVTRGIHTDCLLNYETVKYFGGEEHEAARYRQAISEYQALEYRVILSLNLLNLVQNFIITLGLLVGSLIVARRVIRDGSGSSEFVIFITYLAQLYTPLNQLGYIYRSVNQSLVDTEKLLKLLNEPTDVNDKPNAPELHVTNGEIEFDNVSFSYDGRGVALSGVSFKVPKNSSVALVGESGSGKSTILRLLYRFYDLGDGQGRILIDGQDIRDVTQKSLRQAIGVVPQDSVLFNTTIRYNIGYGKFDATSDEIEIAAKSAQMHERILSFPQGYDTLVGERGVRLSGGEKQRVAIARTLLKNPPILLLDEATSALDTSTERDIQKALQNLMMGRSSLSIAHRLSTIANADLILVLKNGQIVEQGSHKELLAQDGIFAAMWAEQVSSSDMGSINAVEPKQELAGYSLDDDAAQPTTGGEINEAADSEVLPEDPIPSDIPVPGDEKDKAAEDHQPTTETAVEFPSTEPQDDPVTETSAGPQTLTPETSTQPTAPLAFPVSEDPPEAQTTPGVTFDETATPPRTGTPDVEGDTKRKRISSQNFQRLARKISITTKRQGSISSLIPGLKKSESSPRASIDEPTADSPTSSVGGESKAKKKKEKKRGGSQSQT